MKNKHRIHVLGWPAFKHKALNPYNWLLYSAIQKINVDVTDFSVQNILFGAYDIIHIHWPEGNLGRKHTLDAIGKTLYVLLLLSIAKLRGAKVIWTAHNLVPHNGYHPFLLRFFWKIFPRFLDGFISLSKSSHKLVLETYPKLKEIKSFSHTFGIGCYKDVYPNEINQGQARQALDLPQNMFVILFIGGIRQYKNVPALAACFHDLYDDMFLLIAGKPASQSLAKELQTLANQDRRIRLILKFVPDDKLQIFLNAADLVVFPFTNMLNSSSALLALSFNRPVLIPHTGSMVDLQKLLGDKWIQTYKDNFSSIQLLQAIQATKSLQYQKVDLDLSILSWEKIAYDTVSFYRDLLDE